TLVTALMLQLGLLRVDDAEGLSGHGRRERQPISHDSALPPGFGTLERNGMNGAKVSRRGKLSGGRAQRGAGGEAYPSDPYGTGLMFGGGLANGHPTAGRKGKGAAQKAGGRNKKPVRGAQPDGMPENGSKMEARRRGPGAQPGKAPGAESEARGQRGDNGGSA